VQEEKNLNNLLIVIATKAREAALTSGELDGIWSEISALESEKDSARQTADADAAKRIELQRAHEQASSQLKAQIQQAQQKASQLKGDIKRTETEKGQLDDTVEGARKQVELTGTLDGLRADLRQAEQDLAEARNQLQQATAAHRQQMTGLASSASATTSSIADKESRLKALYIQSGRLICGDSQLSKEFEKDLGPVGAADTAVAELRATIAGYQQDIQGYPVAPASMVSVLITAGLLIISLAMTAWGFGDSGHPYHVAWAGIGAAF
jgi:chromosome segregation ATPase